MSQDLDRLRQTLIEGLKRAGQGSYERRAPAKAAVPSLREARAGLKAHLAEHAEDVEGWRLLAQAEECLLSYTAARRCLERVLELEGRPDQKLLKRLAQLKEHEKQWAELGLSPEQLAALGRALDAKLTRSGCDHSLRFTREWLETQGVRRVNQMLAALRNRGGYCDCEVLYNVVAD